MAGKTKAKPNTAKHKDEVKAEETKIRNEGLVSYSRKAMFIFGSYTIESRAVPDYRDGLKPVHRRLCWAAFKLDLLASKGVVKKSARIIGDTIGKYHPHGDSACYDAMVTLANQLHYPIYGSGNFGSLLDPPAAYRYTEARLSDYGERNFFDYINVAEKITNFDGSEQEPLILPSSVPSLLLNGSFGIATGGTSKVSAFQPEGVIKLTKLALSGTPITVKMCMKELIPTCPEGGYAWLEDSGDKDDWSYTGELKRFFETGLGSLYWMPESEIDVEKRHITLTGFVPAYAIGLGKSLEKCGQLEEVSEIENISDIDKETRKTKLAYRIHVKKSIPKDEVEALLTAIQSNFEGSSQLVFNVNQRDKNDLNEADVSFETITMPEFFRRWAEWRTELELKQIAYDLVKVEAALQRNELLKLAVDNLDTIVKALRRDDTEDFMMKQLKITREQVMIILSLTVGRLKKLEAQKIVTAIKEGQAAIKRLNGERKNPVPRIHAVVDEVAALL